MGLAKTGTTYYLKVKPLGGAVQALISKYFYYFVCIKIRRIVTVQGNNAHCYCKLCLWGALFTLG